MNNGHASLHYSEMTNSCGDPEIRKPNPDFVHWQEPHRWTFHSSFLRTHSLPHTPPQPPPSGSILCIYTYSYSLSGTPTVSIPTFVLWWPKAILLCLPEASLVCRGEWQSTAAHTLSNRCWLCNFNPSFKPSPSLPPHPASSAYMPSNLLPTRKVRVPLGAIHLLSAWGT